jgi:hypothetical protein
LHSDGVRWCMCRYEPLGHFLDVWHWAIRREAAFQWDFRSFVKRVDWFLMRAGSH